MKISNSKVTKAVQVTTPVFKQIITPQAHPCKTFIPGCESLPAQSSTQDMRSSQGLPVSGSELAGTCVHPNQGLSHAPNTELETALPIKTRTKQTRVFMYTQDGSGSDDFRDLPFPL